MGAENEDFATLFEKSLKAHQDIPMDGDIVRGKIIHITHDAVIIDFGHKSEGQIPLFEFLSPEGVPTVKVGDTVQAYVETIESDNGLAILSKEKADALQVWDRLQEVADKDETIDGVILSRVKGGFNVDIGVKAFLPASQVDLRPGSVDRLMGKKMKFKILKLNKRKGNIIVSRRALMERDRDFARHEILQNFTEGQTQKGMVKNITDYGAFIDLGGIDGLLHVTDMSWGRVNHPSEVVSAGQEVTVKILRVDPESGKVSLGLKQLTPDPWEKVADKFSVGQRIHGKIVNVTDFGAFVELAPGVEGLVHVSEMSWSRKVKHPSKIANPGDQVEVVILDVDPISRRISLGMKQITQNPWDIAAEKFKVGARVSGPVRNVTDFGIFVGLTDEVDGLAHLSDLFWVKSGRPLTEIFPKGTMVEAVVLHSDKENERFSLGVKQLFEDPWPRLLKEFKIGTEHPARVTHRSPKGIGVELFAGVEGFIPQTELPDEGASLVADSVTIVIHSLDERERRIGLGLVVK